MRRLFLSLFACGLIGTGIVGVNGRPVAVAQDARKVAAKDEKSADGKSAKKVSSGDRLPANYAKIGLSDDQKKKIYDVQNNFEAQIDTLEKQIADLKAKQKAEVEGVLTPEQHKALQASIEDSKKKAAEKKKATEAKAGETKKVDM